MEVLKKNLFSIIFGVVAILAVGALFWPTGGMYDGLQTEMKARMAVAQQIESLVSAKRSMPILSPDEADPQPLEVYPTEQVISAGEEATKKISDQAQNMSNVAVDHNVHTLLLSDELPKPNDSARYTFALTYQATVDKYARWKEKLHSGTPPTTDEIKAQLQELEARIKAQTPDPQQAAIQLSAESPAVAPNMAMKNALENRIYVLPGALPIDPKMTPTGTAADQAPDRIADAQIMLWVVDDVTGAIARANDKYSDPATPGGATPQYDVLHSAVKQIEKIEGIKPVLSPSGADLTAGVTSATPKKTFVSPTGRVCNALYDVLRFKVSLVIDAAKIAEIVRELELNQFITVLNVQINEVVDPVKVAERGFRFGDKPVVRVEFDCEELLLRKWTDSLLPDSMKNGLGKGNLAATSAEDQGDQQYGQPDLNGGEQPPPDVNGGSPFGGPHRHRLGER